MVLKTLFIAYILHLISYTHGWSVVTSRPIEEPAPRLMTQEDVYNRQDEYRLSDVNVGLTALKDKKLVSCFVNDYDPLWLPAPSDKRYIIKNQPCDKVNKNTDFTTLRKKAGPKIADMCKDLYVFWLAARNMEPPPLPGMFPQQHSRPCPFDDDLPIPPAVELPDGENVQSGKSGTQMSPDREPPVLHDGAPPMIQDSASSMSHDGAPPMLRNGAPPMLHEGAPPMLDNGAPPMLREIAPKMSRDGAPPKIDDGAPPVSHEIAPPMLAGGAPPMSHEESPQMIIDGAPPMLQDGAPPMLQDGAPPMIEDGAPPMLQDGAPPMITEGEMQPPLAEKSHPRRDLDALSMAKPQPPSLAAMLKKMVQENREAADIIAPPTPDMKTPPPPKRFGRNILRALHNVQV